MNNTGETSKISEMKILSRGQFLRARQVSSHDPTKNAFMDR